MAKSKPSRGKDKPKMKSFSDLHGPKSSMFKGVTPEQLGHDQQIPTRPISSKNSPLANPGEPGHYMSNPGRIGESMGYNPGSDPTEMY